MIAFTLLCIATALGQDPEHPPEPQAQVAQLQELLDRVKAVHPEAAAAVAHEDIAGACRRALVLLGGGTSNDPALLHSCLREAEYHKVDLGDLDKLLGFLRTEHPVELAVKPDSAWKEVLLVATADTGHVAPEVGPQLQP